MSQEHEVEGWEVPLCRPLTRRVMFGGVPFFVMVGHIFAGMQFVNLKLYYLLLVLPVSFLVMRAFYAHDEWGVESWLENVRSTTQGKNRMEV